MIAKLVQAGADPNERRSLGGETALMMASRTGNVAAIQVLLDHGAEVNAKTTLARDHGVDVGGGPGPSGRGPALDRARSGRQRPLES